VILGRVSDVAGRDRVPLDAVAAELDHYAELLRIRSARVAADPDRVRWSSLGARAWAESVTTIRDALLRAAGELEQAAAALRSSSASRISHADAGR
jgi:hypothetical protein